MSAIAVQEDEQSLTSVDICKMANVTYRQLDHWCRRGVIDSVVPAIGPGTSRRFVPHQVWVLKALKRLSAIGCCSERFQEVGRWLVTTEATQGWLIVPPEGTPVIIDDEHPIDSAVNDASWVVRLTL